MGDLMTGFIAPLTPYRLPQDTSDSDPEPQRRRWPSPIIRKAQVDQQQAQLTRVDS